jgi:hypothetical protein
MKSYKLMSSLFAHTGDVKSLSATRDDGGFVSVSRDLSTKLWIKNEYNQIKWAFVVKTLIFKHLFVLLSPDQISTQLVRP